MSIGSLNRALSVLKLTSLTEVAASPVAANTVTAGRPIENIGTHERDPQRIPIARCRALLGDQAVGLSDDEVVVIRQHAHTMAHVLIEILVTGTPRT